MEMQVLETLLFMSIIHTTGYEKVMGLTLDSV